MKRPITELQKDIVFTLELRGRRFTFHSTWGLFSPESSDAGSRLLLECLEVQPIDTVLDLGCGYGVLGIVIAKETPLGITHLVDKDFVAVEYTKKNVELNNVSNAQIYLSNGFSAVPKEARFDVIVSNLPAKVGRELYYIFFNDAHSFLKPGGRIVVVTIAGLKDFIKKSFTEIFGNYRKVKQSGTHAVMQAVKR